MFQSSLPESLKTNLKGLDSKALSRQFESIAHELMSHYRITKKADNLSPDIHYHFMELEFYYYSPEHPDIITYPRKTNTGDWFFHASGVDISFESDIESNPETGKFLDREKTQGFGGILIRALSKQQEGKETTYIMGPQKCCYELFDRFSAFESPTNFPLIERGKINEIKLSSCERHIPLNTTLEHKLKMIHTEYWDCKEYTQKDKDLSDFAFYLKKDYRFFDETAFNGYLKYKKEHKSCRNYNANPLSKAHKTFYRP